MQVSPDFIRARTARHRRLAEIGDGGADRLAGARVVVVGAGGLGSTAIPYLAAAGVGRIDVFDDDVVEVSNLNRQVLHSVDTLGQPKVASAKAAGERIAPEVQVVGHQMRLGTDFADVVGPLRPDIIIDGSDSFDTRFVVDEGAAKLGVPVVFGALMQWSAQVTVFDAAGRYGPAVRLTDIFPDSAEVRATPGCAEMGILGSVSGMVGTMLATEAIKLIVGAGKNLVGRMLVVDALDMQITEIALHQPAQSQWVNIPAVSAEILVQDDPPVVLDVRRAEEIAEEPVELDTVDIPFDQLNDQTQLALLDKGRPIVTLCRTGPRSIRAAQQLAAAGHNVVGYLDGGMQALQSEANV